MIKPIIWASALFLLVGCGSGNAPVNEPVAAPTPTEVIPELPDGVVSNPDTIPQQEVPQDEKTPVKSELPKPNPKEVKQNEKPGKPSIHGSWELEKVVGAKEPFNMLFPNQAPTISFDLKTNELSGNNGCNSYNGPFKLRNGVLTIEDMISTRMFCQDVNEKLFMTTLKMANNYSIDENKKLHLRLDDEDLLVFKAK